LNKRNYVAPALFAATLLVSLILYTVAPPELERRLLFFPDTAGGERHAERHYVPRRSAQVDQIQIFIEELQLGPVQLGSVPFIPDTAELRSLVLDEEGVLYIDFTPNIMFDEQDSERNFSDLEELLTENLHHNFPSLESSVVLVGGQVPDAPSFGEISR